MLYSSSITMPVGPTARSRSQSRRYGHVVNYEKPAKKKDRLLNVLIRKAEKDVNETVKRIARGEQGEQNQEFVEAMQMRLRALGSDKAFVVADPDTGEKKIVVHEPPKYAYLREHDKEKFEKHAEMINSM